jgi:hypothetical protein
MKLEDFQTPIADEIWDRYSEDGDDFSFTMYLSHQAVEKKLALAVAALKSARKALCSAHYALLETAPCAAETCKQTQSEAVVSAELVCRMEIKVTAETIAQIEEGK